MVIYLAPVSLSNKKVNFYTCQRLTFLKKNATENAYMSISENFLAGHAPRPSLAARALGARNLPRLVLKSGYGPDDYDVKPPNATFNGSINSTPSPHRGHLSSCRSRWWGICQETSTWGWGICHKFFWKRLIAFLYQYFTSKHAYLNSYS